MRAALARRLARRLASANELQAVGSASLGPLEGCGAQPLAQTPSPAPVGFCRAQRGAAATSAAWHGEQHARQPAGWGTCVQLHGAAAASSAERALPNPWAAWASGSAAPCKEDWRGTLQQSSEPRLRAGTQQQPAARWPSSGLLAGPRPLALCRPAEAQANTLSGLLGGRCQLSAHAGARCSSTASSSGGAAAAPASRPGTGASSEHAPGSGSQGQAASAWSAQQGGAAGGVTQDERAGAGGPAVAQTAAQVLPLAYLPHSIVTSCQCMESSQVSILSIQQLTSTCDEVSGAAHATPVGDTRHIMHTCHPFPRHAATQSTQSGQSQLHTCMSSMPCTMQAAALQARNEWVNLPNAISAARALSGPGRACNVLA